MLLQTLINYLFKNGLGLLVIVFRLCSVASPYQEPAKYTMTSWLS